eukprot:TRINITY_DN9325_c0_g2_i6.p1 TRINITY_DN9325_c0_g2~~TRINITY_DN9325_c0_g2_i6.p1  ORF type:complete len:140 (-),score=26.21 TRINITY_DN9325_c0_g2_i6:22-441(-)
MMTARMSDKDTREDINKVFRLFDEDNTGFISIKNLRRVAKELGENISEEELQEMIERADSNGDQQVTADDFYNIMTKKTFPCITLRFRTMIQQIDFFLISYISHISPFFRGFGVLGLSLIHICRCRRYAVCRSRWSPYH